MIADDIEGEVTVALSHAPIIDIMNAISKSNGLEYAVERGILRIGRKDQFTSSGEDLKTETIRLSYAVSKDMVDKIKGLLTSRGSVFADERTNSLVVRETMANLEHVRNFVDNVDIRDAQVLIEAKIVEATRQWMQNLGVRWGVNTTTNKFNVQGVDAIGAADSGRRSMVDLPAANPTSGIQFLIGTLAGGTSIDGAITAAESNGDLHVISEPSIVTSNGVPAHIRSGDTIYVKTQGSVSIGSSSVGGGSGLEKITTGVELQVTPHISLGEMVKMEIVAITSAPDFTRTVDGVPAVLDNKATTTVLVRDNEMTVIGGLLRFRGQDTTNRVPFLGRLPLLGYIFRSKNRSKTNTDLMVFIRPRIVRHRVPSSLQGQLPAVERAQRSITLKGDEERPAGLKKENELGWHNKSTRIFRSKYIKYRH